MTSAFDASSQPSKSARSSYIQDPMGNTTLDIPILKALQAAVIIIYVAGNVTYWNPFAERLYGWPSEEVVGRSIMGITVSTENAEVAARHMASLHAGNSWSGEFAVRCKNGEFLPALVTLSPLFDDTGVRGGHCRGKPGHKRAQAN